MMMLASVTTTGMGTARHVLPGREQDLSFSVEILQPRFTEQVRHLLWSEVDHSGELGELGPADLAPPEGFQGQAQEPMAEFVARRFVVNVWEVQQRRNLAALSRLLLLLESLELGVGEKAKVSEAIEGGEAAHSEMVREFGDVVQLDIVALWYGSASNLDHVALIEDVRPKSARAALADPGHEPPDAVLWQQEARGEGIRAYLDQVVPVGCPADGTQAVAV